LVAFSGISVLFSLVSRASLLSVCPYGRLQGVLLDDNSINVPCMKLCAGEPRSPIRKNQVSLEPKGDWRRSVVFCVPSLPNLEFDIRNGIQMEMCELSACIDACDEVMVKSGSAKGIDPIRFRE